MYPRMNELLVAGSYFFMLLLTIPGLIAWRYESWTDEKQSKNANRVIHLGDQDKNSPRAA